MTTSIRTNTDAFEAKRQAFREDYTDMRSWGMTHERIAQQLGIKRESLLRRCIRAGVYIPEQTEADLLERLNHLVDLGRPFIAADLGPCDKGLLGGVLRRALYQGRIQSVGSRPNPHGGTRTQIWCAAEGTQSVAS